MSKQEPRICICGCDLVFYAAPSSKKRFFNRSHKGVAQGLYHRENFASDWKKDKSKGRLTRFFIKLNVKGE